MNYTYHKDFEKFAELAKFHSQVHVCIYTAVHVLCLHQLKMDCKLEYSMKKKAAESSLSVFVLWP